MTDVKSKNLYELLGNDHDQDSDKEPEPPVKTVDKPLPRSGKRDAPKVEQTADVGAPPPRRNYERRGGGFNDGERSFRDRTNARNNPNRDNPVENTDGVVRGRDSGPGTQRGGRGQRGPRRGGDRQNKTGRTEHEKQSDQAWGQPTGEGEQEDEKVGEQIAQEDRKEAVAEDVAEAVAVPEAEPEPEDKSLSYTDYLAQQAAKKLEGLGLKEARAPNEGAKENKQWKSATQLAKEADEDYFKGEGKAKRERERTAKKQVLDIDYSFKEQPREIRGGGRGGRGRGEGRGEGRGGGRGRGDGTFRPRGDRADRGDRGDRGSYRGGRGRSEATPAPTNDETAFPALGS